MPSDPNSTSNDALQNAIAVIGLGCRFPGGADNPDAFWNLLVEGKDAITRTPEERWNLSKFYASGDAVPGKTQSQWGGYVRDLDLFDPQLFGISPREAASMDPQQRMLLEVAWQATEDAGCTIERLAGSSTAVFVGISSFDYAVAGLSFQDRSVIGPYSNTGGSSSIAANRISYCFDLRGPSVAVDTACSSSLVALHMACESLRNGEARQALAGGVNALLLPDFYIAFSQLGVLSPHGRCKTFDARADGYVRSEGAGMVLLKRYQDAVQDGDEIHCVIRSTALNQDGHTDGMTVPSGDAQAALMRTAYKKAGVDPRLVGYIEAHGTGTPIGDPIEASAIGQVIGADRGEHPHCYIGSVKTNIGHLEAGAGIASVLKVALSLKHQTIPQHLHFESLNPAIHLQDNGLDLPLATQPWDAIQGRRIAGINGFGYGGANAHVVLESTEIESTSNDSSPVVPANQQLPSVSTPWGSIGLPLPITADSDSALQNRCEQWADWLESSDVEVDTIDLIASASQRCSQLRQRRLAFGNTALEFSNSLRQASESPTASVHRLSKAGREFGILFVCCGQGPQHWAMGRQLLAAGGEFARTLEKCDAEFSRHVDWSLLEELQRDERTSRMNETSIAQPALFAIQVALADQWRAYGVTPSAVLGHSVGEIAAAHLSGGLNFQDACLVAVHRGRTMDLASSRGSMIAAGISADAALSRIAGQEHLLSLAAINGPASVTISGDSTAIQTLARDLESEGVFCRSLAVEYAFHSPQMDPVEFELLRSLAGIQPQATSVPMISTVSGQPIQGDSLDANYWWKNVRQSVQFAPAMQSMLEQGCECVVEIGPHPVLSYAIHECCTNTTQDVQTIASMRRDEDDVDTFRSALTTLHQINGPIEWSSIANAKTRRRLRLPRYPMQKQKLWSESAESIRTRTETDHHPLLGTRLDTSDPTWQQRLSLSSHAFLSDHQVRKTCLYPAAASVESALSIAQRVRANETLRLNSLRWHRPLVLSNERDHETSSVFREDRNRVEIGYRELGTEAWLELATMDVGHDTPTIESLVPETSRNFSAIRDRCQESIDATRCYAYCERLGLNYGELFQGLRQGVRRDLEALVEIELPRELHEEANGYQIHPALLDACFHSMIVADPSFDHHLDDLYLPHRIEQISWHANQQTTRTKIQVHVRILSKDRYRMLADLVLFDETNEPIGVIRGFESRNAGGATEEDVNQELMYRYRWQKQEEAADTISLNGQRRWIVFADGSGVSDLLVDRQRLMGVDVITVRHADRFMDFEDGRLQLSPDSPQHWDQLLASIPFDSITDVVYAWGLDLPSHDGALDLHEVDHSILLSTRAPVEFVQAWQRKLGDRSRILDDKRPRFSVVTAGAQSRDEHADPIAFCQTPLIGLGRVLISELDTFQTRLIDLPASDAASQTAALIHELTIDDAEDEVMLRDSDRHVRRFVSHSSVPLPSESKGHSTESKLPSRLTIGPITGIEEIRYQAEDRPTLSENEIEIEVRATGLNFSDVMKALDLYPGLPDGPVPLGAECSGIISRIGSRVSGFHVGDEVLAIAKGAFATHVIVNPSLVAKKPSKLTHAQAATVPIAFLTAEHAIHQCARLRDGESLLIHAASGGVGLAAIQLAQRAGLTVYATAGNDEKRAYVRDLGVAHVANSRTLEFADEFRTITGGRGVDAILNSLPGEAITKGLALLKTGGRFLEIGKRDIYGDRALDLTPFRNNLAFFAIDLDQLMSEQPDRLGAMLRSLVSRFEDGQLQPLPVQVFPADQTREAYRFMQQAKHIGKVAVDYGQGPTDVYPCPILVNQRNNPRHDIAADKPVEGSSKTSLFPANIVSAGSSKEKATDLFGANKTYWIAGGMGGFGRRIATWMAENGAGQLVLGGRSHVVDQECAETLKQIRSLGAKVTVIQTDITSEVQVNQTLRKIRDEMMPLGGIFHTAMVLEDRLLSDLDPSTLHRVLRPKVLGGWNLHAASLDRNLVPEGLAHFVLFSSLSSVFGHAGQANYAAANAALDGLAYLRRSQGLPALVVNWGHVGEVGYLAERTELGDRLERQGVLRFNFDEATKCLTQLMRTSAIQASVLKMDWTLWRGLGLTKEISPRFAHLIHQDGAGSEETFDLADLRSADESKRRPRITTLVSNKLSKLLGLQVDQMTAERSLLELGLDSLMAVELRNWIENQFQISMPISELMQGASVHEVAAMTSRQLGESEGPAEIESNSKDPRSAQQLLEEVDSMDEAELDRLLREMQEPTR